jgi:hypothetical protein
MQKMGGGSDEFNADNIPDSSESDASSDEDVRPTRTTAVAAVAAVVAPMRPSARSSSTTRTSAPRASTARQVGEDDFEQSVMDAKQQQNKIKAAEVRVTYRAAVFALLLAACALLACPRGCPACAYVGVCGRVRACE